MALLQGLRVVQFGDNLAAQMVGLALADLGADVVRIGVPGPDPLSAALERGKRIVDTRAGSVDLEGLVKGADAIIEPRFAPASLMGLFPQASIRLSLPAFPTGDSRFAGKADDEGTVLAAAGVLAERGPSNRLRGQGPAPMPMPIASAYAAAFGTLGLLAALYGRQVSGRGEDVEVSLFAALMEGFSYNHLKIHDLPVRYIDPRAAINDDLLPLPEEQVQTLLDPLYRAFQCEDGAWFYVAAVTHAMKMKTLRVLGLWDELMADGLPVDDPYLSTKGWKDSTEGSVFGYPQLAAYWRDRIHLAVAAKFRAHASAHWEAEFSAQGLCGTRIRSSAEWLNSSEVQAANLSISLDDPLIGQLRCPGPFCWDSDSSPRPPREIVAGENVTWRGVPWAIPQASSSAPVPFLSGLRVLDMCNVIAGPTVAGCLTRFGAEVVKIDAPRTSFEPFIAVVMSLQSARGKQSVLLDLARPEGKQAFAAMASSADLVTFNGPQSQIDALGVDIESLAELKPSIVLGQVSAFGGPTHGPLAARKGVDEILQAATGVMHRLKPNAAPPEEYAYYGTIDVATGVWGAAAAVAGLIAARADGSARQVGTSLAAGGAALQMPFLWASDAQGPAPDPVGAFTPFAIGTIEGGHHVSPDGKREPLACFADLRERLKLADDYVGTAVGFVSHGDHPIGETVELVTQCAIVCRDTPLTAPGHPRKYGADTFSVLHRYGMSETEIDRLLGEGIASGNWPNHEQFLPD